MINLFMRSGVARYTPCFLRHNENCMNTLGKNLAPIFKRTFITYIPMKNGFLYLTAVIDWYSRYILSWKLEKLSKNHASNNACSYIIPYPAF